MKSLHLTVASLGDVVIDVPEVASVTAEDDTGAFGLLPGHADFLTVLSTGVVSWHTAGGDVNHCAIRGGVLSVCGGSEVAVATRDAIIDTDLQRLESTVLAEFEARDEAERAARTESNRIELRAIREILDYLRPQRRSRRGEAAG